VLARIQEARSSMSRFVGAIARGTSACRVRVPIFSTNESPNESRFPRKVRAFYRNAPPRRIAAFREPETPGAISTPVSSRVYFLHPHPPPTPRFLRERLLSLSLSFLPLSRERINFDVSTKCERFRRMPARRRVSYRYNVTYALCDSQVTLERRCLYLTRLYNPQQSGYHRIIEGKSGRCVP